MTALKGKAIEAFVNKRDPNIFAVLIYGPDSGLVRERAEKLAKAVVEDFKDPFNYIELADPDLKAEPAQLADEAAALSFAGGERVVRLRTTGEASSKSVKLLIDGLEAGHLKPNALTIIEAGDLKPSSGLRKMFEKAKSGVALPCYSDGAGDVRALAQHLAAAEDLRFEEDALNLAVSILGEDRGISRSELNKLILYKGPGSLRSGPGTITLDDVQASLVDGVSDAMGEVAAAAADGAPERLAKALYKSASAGASPIGLLRAMQRNFARLRAAKAYVEAGESPASAMKKLRPPVFFIEQRPFESRLRRWPLKGLDRALDMLVEAELDAKTTGAPQAEIIERAALRIAVMAAR